MRLLVGITLALSVFLGGRAVAFATCGNDPADAAAVTAAETAIATQCDCCTPRGTYRACVASVVKAAARARALPARCVSKVRRDVAHACPLVPSTIACRVCNADSDCATGEFCECRGGTCTKTGGVCVSRPQVCPNVVASVCGCDGTTYGNDCLRQQAGACKLHHGPCVATGGCFDTIAGQCTGEACSPSTGCPLPNAFCSPACGSPSPTGTCFDTRARKCTTESCGPDHPCLPNAFCVATCPPPPPHGRCFVTVDEQCSTEPCGPGAPCQNPNEFCDPHCLTATCGTNADCDDGNGCTADRCVGGTCEHACICLSPTGAPACCPGPAALCGQPCGADTAGICGGFCPTGANCETQPTVQAACGCVSGAGGPCGGNLLTPPPVCASGLVCQQSLPDVTGVCVAPNCIPLSASGCLQTSDCCEPCVNGTRPPCGVCISGMCVGAP
jgi:hypothetical protein